MTSYDPAVVGCASAKSFRSAPANLSLMVRLVISGLISLSLFLPSLFAKDKVATQLTSWRNDPHLIVATGEGKSATEARENAEKALASQIQVSINSSTELTSDYTETNTELRINSEYVTRHRSYTGLLFKGLRYLESQDGNLWMVAASIHRDSLAASFSLQKSRILSLVSAASEAERQGNLGDALSNVYQAWLFAQFYPDTINLTRFSSLLPPHPKVALSQYLKTLLFDVNITADDCYRDGPSTMAHLNFAHSGLPVKDLTISYYGGRGMEYARVRNGSADIPLGDEPTSADQRLLLTLEYLDASKLETDGELAGLYEIFGAGDFSNLKSISLHFPWLGAKVEVPVVPPAIIAASPEPVPVSTAPNIQLPEPWGTLNSEHSTERFLEVLVQYSKLGMVSYGRKGDFGDGSGCYVAIFDDQVVDALLKFDGQKFKDVNGSEEFTDLSDSFKGRRQVWMKELSQKP